MKICEFDDFFKKSTTKMKKNVLEVVKKSHKT